MAAPKPLTIDCPVCGGLIGWNLTTAPGRAPAVLATLDDLSRRRHRGCGIFPKGAA